MIAVLNCSLDDKAFPGLSLQDRVTFVMSAFHRVFDRCIIEPREVVYVGKDGLDIKEHTAVIQIQTLRNKAVFEQSVRLLCVSLEQDCMPVVYDDGCMLLVGPRADQWGDFNMAFFARPEMFNLMRDAQ